MRIEANAVLSPLFGAFLTWAIWSLVSSDSTIPIVLAVAFTIGAPVAIVLAILTSIYLRRRLLFDAKQSYVLCSAWAGFLAAAVALLVVGTDRLVIPLIFWGLVSGFIFRFFCRGEKQSTADR